MKTLESIKRRAKELRKEGAMTHSQGLEVAAKEAGYSGYHHARSTLADDHEKKRVHEKQEKVLDKKGAVGTAYFADFASACAYYKPYGFSRRDVDRKVLEKEIHIGKPEGKIVAVREGRYFIEA